MKIRNKILTFTLIISIITSFFPTDITYGSSSEQLIYEKKTSQIISTGVTYNNIKRFLTSGWLNINVLTVDLTNPYVKLDLLTSSSGIGTLDNVKNMVSSSGAVAGINADFFDKYTKADKTGGGFPMGFAMKAGEFVSSPFYVNAQTDKFASFSMDNLKQFIFAYVTQKTTLTTSSGTKIGICDLNKYSTNYEIPVLYNKYWGKASIGSSDKFPDMLEMVVLDNVVTEIRSGMPPVTIPSNGYVVSARKDGAKLLKNNFIVGDAVQLDVKTTPDLSGNDFAVSGSTILVRDGKVVPFTHAITGLHPRSAIGTSKDGKYLYAVAVDGRQTLSKGMSQEELAQLMIDLGANNALNFDGGGSTELVGRKLGNSYISTLNSPSEQPLRKVADSLGIFSTAPKGTLKSLVIDTDDSNMFINTSREFTVKGFDENYNVITLNPEEIKWNIAGAKAAFNKNVLAAQEVGEGTVTAEVYNISASMPVSVLSSPVELFMSPHISQTTVGKQVTFSVKGKNKFGYYAMLKPSDLTWSSSNSIGTLSSGVFTANSQGNTIISCSIGKLTAYSGISVAGQEDSVIDPCETPKASFKSFPSEIAGDLSLSYDEKHAGSASYKLTYDFSNITDRSKAAYLVFPDNALTLSNNVTNIGMWVYNPAPKSDWLKAQISDSTGATHLLDLSRDLSWTGWKFIQVPLADSIARPAHISKIYVVQTDPSIMSSGEIRIDDISISSKKSDELKAASIPSNIRLPDSADRESSYKSSEDSFRFAIMGKVSSNKTLLNKLLVSAVANHMDSNVDFSALVGQNTNVFYKSLKKPVFTAISGKATHVYKNSTFIVLDDSKDSIRLTNSAQWKWFENQLSNVKTSNVFILMPKSLDIDSYADPYEANLFKDILTDYKKKTQRNVWLITGGSTTSSTMERGVREVTAAGLTQNTADIATSLDNSKYILVTVKGKEITYQIKNLFE